MEGAQAGAMAVRQHAAPVSTGDHGDPRIRQFFHRRFATDSSAAQPQQRLFRLPELRPQGIHRCLSNRRRRRDVQRGCDQRQGNTGSLNINRDLHRYRPARRRPRFLNRLVQNGDRLVGVADAIRAFRTGFQEGQLIAGFVNKPGIRIQPGFLYLTGQMQQRRTGIHRLHQRPDCVPRPGAGAG